MAQWIKYDRDSPITQRDQLEQMSPESDELLGPFDLWVFCKHVTAHGGIDSDNGRRITGCYFDPTRERWIGDGGEVIEKAVLGGRQIVTHFCVENGPEEVD